MKLSEIASIIVTIAFLGYGSIHDFKTREIPDQVWLAFAPIGLALTTIRILSDTSSLLLVVVSIAVSVIVAIGLVYFGLFGGADAKALICLGLTIPLTPTSINPLVGYLHPFFPILAILLGFVCSLSTAIWIGLKNLMTLARHDIDMFQFLDSEPLWKKALAFFTGYPTSVQELRSTFYLLPMEEFVQYPNGMHGKLRTYVNADVDRDEQVSRLIDSLPNGDPEPLIWVTPALPMLLFILIGVILAIVVGDPIFRGVYLLARH